MQKEDKNYLLIILAHVILGIAIFVTPFVSKIYAYLIIFGGIYFVIKNKNRNNEVLYAAAYIVGSEVLLRMTNGNPNHEFSKYGVMIFVAIGMYYSGFSKNAIPYWAYLILLVPGVIVATQTLNLTTEIRTTIAFNISGPVCLGLASLYTFNRDILFSQINKILLMVGLPVITTAVYLILYTPDLKEAITGTGSNLATSGGFGPNQVATLLGLGMFVFFSRLLLHSKTKLLMSLNLIIAVTITFRGLVTFSRGGMITGFVMIFILLFFIYKKTEYKGKVKLNYLFIFISLAFILTWIYASSQTSGLIEKRYSNRDALGRVKESRFTGREDIFENEIEAFLENPIFGIGVAKGTEIRFEKSGGDIIASHNEISRLLGEHGSLGIMILMILFFTPIFLYLDNKQHIFLFCFLFFWLLTINHAAMRTASPAFIYALSLLNVRFDE
jgi:hypothetical protein